MTDSTPETRRAALENILGRPIIKTLEENGITPLTLALELKAELESGETKTLKIKGKVRPEDLPPGARILTQAEIWKASGNGEDREVYDDGDTVIQWDEVNWGTRQKARQDAHRLMGHYPPEKSGDTYVGLMLQQNNITLSPVVQAVLAQHSKALVEFMKKDDELIEVEVIHGSEGRD